MMLNVGKQAALMGLAVVLGSCQASVTPLQTATMTRHAVLSVQEALSDADSYFITQDRSATYNPTQPPGTNANCGPTSLAMAVKAFHKVPNGLDTPAKAHDLIQYVRKAMTGEVDEQSWTYPTQVERGAEQLGLHAGLVFGSRAVVEALAQPGRLVVVNVNPTPAYVDQLSMPYDGGHFALVTGVHAAGEGDRAAARL